MKFSHVFVILLLGTTLLAQQKLTDRDLAVTKDQEILVRTKQAKMLAATIAAYEAKLAEDAAIAEFNQTTEQVLKDNKVTKESHVLCGGPAVGGCEGAPDERVIIRKRPPEKTK